MGREEGRHTIDGVYIWWGKREEFGKKEEGNFRCAKKKKKTALCCRKKGRHGATEGILGKKRKKFSCVSVKQRKRGQGSWRLACGKKTNLMLSQSQKKKKKKKKGGEGKEEMTRGGGRSAGEERKTVSIGIRGESILAPQKKRNQAEKEKAQRQ